MGFVTCVHCARPACLRACTHDAMWLDEENIVHIDARPLYGCGACVTACPYHVPHLDAVTGKACKCDLCHDRRKAGLEPSVWPVPGPGLHVSMMRTSIEREPSDPSVDQGSGRKPAGIEHTLVQTGPQGTKTAGRLCRTGRPPCWQFRALPGGALRAERLTRRGGRHKEIV